MRLDALTAADMEQIRVWRHEVPETLRTPYMLTAEMQADYYRDVICDRRGTTRYWALTAMAKGVGDSEWSPSHLVGYGGIENISWENRNGEISLLLRPECRGKGYGREAVGLFLEQAFEHMNLECVYGECYMCGPWEFWEKMVVGYRHPAALLPDRKYYQGAYYGSYYFTFDRISYCRLARKRREQETAEQEPA